MSKDKNKDVFLQSIGSVKPLKKSEKNINKLKKYKTLTIKNNEKKIKIKNFEINTNMGINLCFFQ